MARLLLETPGEDVIVGGTVTVVGTTSGGEVVTVTRGDVTLDPSFNAGGDTLVMPGATGGYTARLVGSMVVIEGASATVRVPVGVAGMDVDFADGTMRLRIDVESGTVQMGTQVIASTAQPLTAPASAESLSYDLIDEFTIPFDSYEGSVVSRGVVTDADGTVSVIFGGPLYRGGFVDETLAFQTLTITPDGELVAGPSLDGAEAVHPRIGLTADFDGDGVTDFFSANHGYDSSPFPGETNTLLLSDGSGGYVEGALPDYLDFTHSADVGDIDGDGDVDIYVGPSGLGDTGNRPYFLINDGSGVFEADHDLLQENADSANLLLVSGKLVDIDGDDDLDLVTGGHGDTPNAGWIYFNDGDGNFAEEDGLVLPEALFDQALTIDIKAMDFDNDGDMDLLLAQTRKDPFYGGGLVQVLENDGSGDFTDATAQVLPQQSLLPGDETDDAYISFIYTPDLNGDGYQDIFLSRVGADEQMAWLNDGDGSFTAVSTDQLGLEGVLILPVDYDGDGVSELLAFSRDLSEGQDLTVRLYSLEGGADGASPIA